MFNPPVDGDRNVVRAVKDREDGDVREHAFDIVDEPEREVKRMESGNNEIVINSIECFGGI